MSLQAPGSPCWVSHVSEISLTRSGRWACLRSYPAQLSNIRARYVMQASCSLTTDVYTRVQVNDRCLERSECRVSDAFRNFHLRQQRWPKSARLDRPKHFTGVLSIHSLTVWYYSHILCQVPANSQQSGWINMLHHAASLSWCIACVVSPLQQIPQQEQCVNVRLVQDNRSLSSQVKRPLHT